MRETARPRRLRRVGAVLLPLVASLLAACSVTGLPNVQDAKRIIEAAAPPATGPDPVRDAFRDLGRAAGLDPATLHVAAVGTPFLNLNAYGGRDFLVARPLWTSGDRCLTWGLVAHEVAHAALRQGERLEFAASETGTVEAIARAVGPGVGDGSTDHGWPIVFSHTPAEETAADRLALSLLERAQRPPWMLRHAIGVVEDLHGRREGRAYSWLGTHPVRPARLAGLPAPDGADVDEICGPRATRAERLAIMGAAIDAWNRRRLETIQQLQQDRDRR